MEASDEKAGNKPKIKVLVDSRMASELFVSKSERSFEDAAALLIGLSKSQQIEVYATELFLSEASLSVSRFEDNTELFIEKLKENLNYRIIYVDKEIIGQATLTYPFLDEALAVDLFCGVSQNFGAIITPRAEDFPGVNLSIITVTELLKRLHFDEVFELGNPSSREENFSDIQLSETSVEGNDCCFKGTYSNEIDSRGSELKNVDLSEANLIRKWNASNHWLWRKGLTLPAPVYVSNIALICFINKLKKINAVISTLSWKALCKRLSSNLSGNGKATYPILPLPIQLKFVQNRCDLSGMNLSGQNFSGADLRHANFHGANLSGVNFSGANLSGANLSGVNLNGANLTSANLQHTDLCNADLLCANLSRAQLKQANLESANLVSANLYDSCLHHANLQKARLCGANLSKVDLSYANLSHADITGGRLSDVKFTDTILYHVTLERVDLTAADLQQADMREAKLNNALLSGTNLSGANLTYAQMNGVILRGADLSQAQLCGAELDGANLDGANLSRANLEQAHLRGTRIRRANLQYTQLNEAKLDGASLRASDLSGATLQGSSFKRAKLLFVNLQGADLSGAHLSNADLRGANLEQANLSGADLSGAKLMAANLARATLHQARLLRVNLSDARLRHTLLTEVRLNRAYLSGADLYEADLREADLSGANLLHVNLRRANLQNACLIRAYLNNVDLSHGNLNAADLNETNLTRVKLDHTTVVGATFEGNLGLSDRQCSDLRERGASVIPRQRFNPYLVEDEQMELMRQFAEAKGDVTYRLLDLEESQQTIQEVLELLSSAIEQSRPPNHGLSAKAILRGQEQAFAQEITAYKTELIRQMEAIALEDIGAWLSHEWMDHLHTIHHQIGQLSAYTYLVHDLWRELAVTEPPSYPSRGME